MKPEFKDDLIIGKRPIFEAIRAGVCLKRVDVLDSIEQDALLKRIFELVQKNKVKVRRLSKKEFARVSKDAVTQGIVAVASEFKYASLNDVLGKSAAKERALIIVCDHITDVGNFGAIIRSAESAGAACVIVPNARSARVTSAVYKTSAGAVAHLPIVQVSNVSRTLDVLKDAGFWVVGASEHAENLLWSVNLEGRIAIVLGNEEKGISDLVLKNCDDTAKLPQLGDISSLNVAQASTVFMYEWVRQNEV